VYRPRTHPVEAKGHRGKSELLRLVTGYNAPFNIDLDKIEGFEMVREVDLARNYCLHNGGAPTEDYMTLTKQQLLDKMVNLNLTPKQLGYIFHSSALCSIRRNVRKAQLAFAAEPGNFNCSPVTWSTLNIATDVDFSNRHPLR